MDLDLAETEHTSCSEGPKREEAQQEGGRNPWEDIQPASHPIQVNTQCAKRDVGTKKRDKMPSNATGRTALLHLCLIVFRPLRRECILTF